MAGTRLFVGNLPYSTTEQQLRDLFGRSGGKVASVRLITDVDTGRSKGYAFVEMATPEEAEKAIKEFNSANVGGRSIVVDEARPRGAGGGSSRKGGRPS